MSFKRVDSGRPLPRDARTWNRLLEATEFVEGLRRKLGGGAVELPRSQTTVKVRNDTGVDLLWYAPVQLGAPIITAADNLAEYQARSNFKGILPDGVTGSLAVTLEPLSAGGIGSAVVSGVVAVLVDRTSVSHEFARLVAGDVTELHSDADLGARILDPPPGTGVTGVQWCTVLLPYQCCRETAAGSAGETGSDSVEVLADIEVVCMPDGTIQTTKTYVSVRAADG